jgi:uncharacterized protein YndB with AHSA1/START domain
MAQEERPVGLTRDTGFQAGARRTLPVSLDRAWALVTSPEGMEAWLGGDPGVPLEAGRPYEIPGGPTGEIRVAKPLSHLRLTWQPGSWSRPSTLQLRVLPAAAGTTIALHQEHLPDADARERRLARFAEALDALERLAAR